VTLRGYADIGWYFDDFAGNTEVAHALFGIVEFIDARARDN